MSSSVSNSLLLRALRGEPVPRPPVWMMRQAGRYMPEYQAVRQRYDFLTLCKTPEAAAEVTLQPVEILGVDAAIVFNDILVPLEAMGMEVVFGDGGPALPDPIRDRAGVERLGPLEPERNCPWVGETIERVVERLGSTPCLGFAGAPFTLAAYAVEGTTSRSFRHTRALMYRDPDTFDALLERLADAVADYLLFQARAGAAAVQIFDTWAGELPPDLYRRFAHRWQCAVIERVRPHVPVILFVLGTPGVFDAMLETGASALSVDWRIDMARARAEAGDDIVLQGNLDPAALYADPAEIERRAHAIIRAAGPRRHIFNLGHGIFQDTPVAHARALVDAVKRWPGWNTDGS